MPSNIGHFHPGNEVLAVHRSVVAWTRQALIDTGGICECWWLQASAGMASLHKVNAVKGSPEHLPSSSYNLTRAWEGYTFLRTSANIMCPPAQFSPGWSGENLPLKAKIKYGKATKITCTSSTRKTVNGLTNKPLSPDFVAGKWKSWKLNSEKYTKHKM